MSNTPYTEKDITELLRKERIEGIKEVLLEIHKVTSICSNDSGLARKVLCYFVDKYNIKL